MQIQPNVHVQHVHLVFQSLYCRPKHGIPILEDCINAAGNPWLPQRVSLLGKDFMDIGFFSQMTCSNTSAHRYVGSFAVNRNVRVFSSQVQFPCSATPLSDEVSWTVSSISIPLFDKCSWNLLLKKSPALSMWKRRILHLNCFSIHAW